MVIALDFPTLEPDLDIFTSSEFPKTLDGQYVSCLELENILLNRSLLLLLYAWYTSGRRRKE